MERNTEKDAGSSRNCRRYWVTVFLVLFAVAGCAAVGPDYVRPDIKAPARWDTVAADPDGIGKADPDALAAWWHTLDDPVLNRLIDAAAANNLDVKSALSRVREARARKAKSTASQLPGVDATASAQKRLSSSATGSSETSELYSAGVDAGWEIDLFGGVRRSVEAAQADIEAGVEDLNDVMVTLLAEVALNYVDVRTYQARLAVTSKNIDAQLQTWEILETLFQAGMGDALAVDQARYNLESSRAKIPDLNVGLTEAVNRLVVLTGQPSETLRRMVADDRSVPGATLQLAVGVPADLLRRRPDIRRAERELAAQTARVGEAEAARYPTFTLNGSIGLDALSIGSLFASGSRSGSFGPAFNWPVFDGGALRANVRVQGELQQQARLNYEASVLNAVEEVENALAAYVQEQHKYESLAAAADSARSASDLAAQQYASGLIGFSDVLEAQRSLLSFEDQLAQSRGTLLSDLVRLYKALGGGWQSFGQPSFSDSPDDKG
jgi:NodT family efflux transporter outer membrane factor (OMF) lipoprotein